MKTYVITVSEFFPKNHFRTGERTHFQSSIKHHNKIHTIRANYELWRKRFKKIDKGEACLSIRVWEGKPYASKQREIFRYEKTDGIGLEKLDASNLIFAIIEDKRNICWDDIAKNDGLTFMDFVNWFKTYDKTKPLAIVHFTNFRYCDNGI